MSVYAKMPLKPAKHIIPFTKKEKDMWNKEEQTVDLTIYNQSLLRTIKEFDRKTAEEEKKKEDLEWYGKFYHLKEEDRANYEEEKRVRYNHPNLRRSH